MNGLDKKYPNEEKAPRHGSVIGEALEGFMPSTSLLETVELPKAYTAKVSI